MLWNDNRHSEPRLGPFVLGNQIHEIEKRGPRQLKTFDDTASEVTRTIMIDER